MQMNWIQMNKIGLLQQGIHLYFNFTALAKCFIDVFNLYGLVYYRVY